MATWGAQSAERRSFLTLFFEGPKRLSFLRVSQFPNSSTPSPCYLEKLPTSFDGTDSIRFASMQASLRTHKSSENHVWKRMGARVGLEAGIAFGFGFKKPGFSRKCWFSGRLRLPSIQKLLASESASASLNAVFDGFGFGFVIFFTAGFGFGFGFTEFRAWHPRFNRRFDKTFIHELRFDFFLPAGRRPFRLHSLVALSCRLSRYRLCLSCAGRKTI